MYTKLMHTEITRLKAGRFPLTPLFFFVTELERSIAF